MGFRKIQENLEKRIEAEGDKSITVGPLDFFNLPLPLAKVDVVRKGKIPSFNINNIIEINGLGSYSLIFVRSIKPKYGGRFVLFRTCF